MIFMSDIKAAVARRHGITVEDLDSPRRHREIARPRHEAISLAAFLTEHSITNIGRMFHRDCSTARHSLREAARLRQNDEDHARMRSLTRQLLRDQFERGAL